LHLGADAADPVDADTHDQSLLPGLTEGIFVGAEKSLGELVDMIVGTGLRDSGLAVEDGVDLRVAAILHGDQDAGIAAQVLQLASPFCGVNNVR
jgi:hypothetical protein